MAVAAIQNPNLATQQLNQNEQSQASHSLELDNLVDPASAMDMSTFHATVQQSILQNPVLSEGANTTYSADSLSKGVMTLIDNIQDSRKRVADYSANITHLTMQQTLELQEATESMSLNVQFFSKGLSLVTKAVDSLVHMQ